jgi:FkbM family methyltransferase
MYLSFDEIVKTLNLNIKGVIHVGGHVGEEIPVYQKYTNNIYIFEPQKDCFDKITNDVNKFNCALGHEEGEFVMYLADNKQSSSLMEPKTHLKEHPSVLFVDTAIVEVKTLDSFDITSCNFLNMDVQGYELNVLKGGVDTLKHIDAVYTEVNTDELYTNNPLIEEMDEWLKEKGFIRVWTHITPNHWGDALYVKQ